MKPSTVKLLASIAMIASTIAGIVGLLVGDKAQNLMIEENVRKVLAEKN